ncbi:DExH-box ATP-dependent RNA helicase DExH13 [Camellia lanceoleosa]|nr:DExH-box ATP-dependent RNA helicase DExH13 [Camellia lanceoleosa]
MEDDERRELLQMSDSQLMDIARVCNHFPNIDLTYDVVDGDNVRAGDDVSLQERRPIPSISCVILIWVVTKNIALLLRSEKQALLKTTVEENE